MTLPAKNPGETPVFGRITDKLRLLAPRDIAALYYGTVQMLHDAEERRQLPRSQQLDNPAGRIELANLHRMLLAEAILRLVAVDIAKATTVATYLNESLDPSMQALGRLLEKQFGA